MNKKSKILCLFITTLFLANLFTGCKKSSTEQYYSQTSSKNEKDYDICIYNARYNVSETFQKLVDEYYSENGVKIKVISPSKEDDSFEKLNSQLNSYEYPTIYSITSFKELSNLQHYGFAWNFNDSNIDNFKELTQNIPNDMRLSLNDSSNFGIPYGIEGYGYLVDRNVISSIFGNDNVDSFINDLKSASYNDFEMLIKALDYFIKNNESTYIYLNGNKYPIAPQKDDISKKLTGVFSVAGSEQWTYINHMINIAINTTFDSSLNAMNANKSQVELLYAPLKAYSKALDLKTSHTAGENGQLERSDSYINPELSTYDQAVKNFSDGKSIFICQGNWSYNDIEKNNPELSDRLNIIPIKLPLNDYDIHLNDISVESFNKSIPVYVSMYYGINAKTSDKEKKLAQDFLVWLNTSDLGKKYIINEFKYIPYDCDNNFESSYLINNSILEYRKAGNTLSGAYMGSPYCSKNSFLGTKIKNEYLTKKFWSSKDYEYIANLAIEQWWKK